MIEQKTSDSEIVTKIKSNIWCIENLDILNYKFLEKGPFGEMVSVRLLKTQKEIALKYMSFSDNQEFKTAIEEIVKMNFLSHPNIIKNYGYFPEAKVERNGTIIYKILLAIELGSSSIDDFLKKNGALSNEQLTNVFEQLGSALTYAHSMNMVHYDLKPVNILIVEGEKEEKKGCWTAKICGWGRKTIYMDSKEKTTITDKSHMVFQVNHFYRPEIRKYNGDISENINIDFKLADIYSLGLILLNCCGIPTRMTQTLSYYSDKEKEHDKEVKEFIDEIREKGVYSIRILDAIQIMLSFEPEKRREFYVKLLNKI